MQLTFPPKISSQSTKPTAAKQRRSEHIREHLANERTYLAWMRSAVSLMGFGVVIVRIRMLQPPMMPSVENGWKLGLAFAFVGLIMVWLSTQHYYAVRRDIDEDNFEPSDRWVALFSLAVLLLGAGVIYYVFSVPLQTMTGYVFE
jgi:putative membrane protein